MSDTPGGDAPNAAQAAAQELLDESGHILREGLYAAGLSDRISAAQLCLMWQIWTELRAMRVGRAGASDEILRQQRDMIEAMKAAVDEH